MANDKKNNPSGAENNNSGNNTPPESGENGGSDKDKNKPPVFKKDKTPVDKKKFKKNDVVYWISKSRGIHVKNVAKVILVVKKNFNPEKSLKRLNKKTTKLRHIEIYYKNKKRPTESYIVSIKDKKNNDVLYWPELSRLEKQV